MSVYLPRHGLMDEGLCEFTLKIPREKKKKKKFTFPVRVYASFDMFSVKCVSGFEKGAEKGRIRATVVILHQPSRGKGC